MPAKISFTGFQQQKILIGSEVMCKSRVHFSIYIDSENDYGMNNVVYLKIC